MRQRAYSTLLGSLVRCVAKDCVDLPAVQRKLAVSLNHDNSVCLSHCRTQRFWRLALRSLSNSGPFLHGTRCAINGSNLLSVTSVRFVLTSVCKL